MFQFECLVAANLDIEVFTGTPFMEVNNIAVWHAKCLITLSNQLQHPAINLQHPITSPPPQHVTDFSLGIQLDPVNHLKANLKSSLHSLLSYFNSVIDPKIQGYNGAVGRFEGNEPVIDYLQDSL